MKKYVIIILVLGLASCTANKTLVKHNAISQKEFLEKPFGFEESIESFSNISKPKFKTQKLLRRNKHYSEKTDTIYHFTYKKSEMFFYKAHTNHEFLLAGKVVNKQIVLKNDIRVGITKTDFENKFSDKLSFTSDSVQMLGEGTKYTFVFKDEKLKRINIDNYFD